MAYIRPSTATIATLYTHFIIFVVVAAFNFSIVDNVLPINFGYGLSLIVLSLISLVLGITSQDEELSLLRSLLMSISALWTSVGLYHVVESFTPQDVRDSEALFAGYGAYLLAFLFFIGGALHHRDRLSAVVALGMFLACIFDITSLWRPLHRSAAACYLLLAAVTGYLAVSKLLVRFRKGEPKTKISKGHESKISKDFIPMGHLMNTVSAAVYAGHVTGIYSHPSFAFSWVFVAGVYQLVAAIIAVRRNQIYQGVYFIFHATFWITNGFNLAVIFVTQEEIPTPLIAATVIHFIVFFIIALISLTKEIFQVLQNLALCVLCVAILVDSTAGAFLGAMGWILFVFSLYTLAAHISRVKNSGFKLPLGARLIAPEKMTDFLLNACKCCASRVKTVTSTVKQSNALFPTDFTLGYSRYGGFDVAGFALNAIAAVAILWTPEGLWVLPWAVILGGLAQMMVGSVCFAKGLSFESCAFFTMGSFWLIWGPARGSGNLALDNSGAIIAGCIGFLAVALLLCGLSLTISKAWTALTFFFNLVIVGILLHSVNANGSFIYEIVINILFVVVCMYCFVATALRSVWGKELLPLGKPVIQVSYLHSQGDQAFWADARRTTGVKAIAEIMNRGGICGVPTDTVYVLVAACKFPAAVERAYNTKKLAEDRPMSMWISKVEQLEAGRPLFGELIWGLMNEIWPSTVSLVVPKGEWLQSLGIGDAEKYIGRPDSIACRMPDNTATSHLIDQTGPIAVTSANPTGEADTTHHLQVVAKLGVQNCDGILCAGPSPENMASTVVDCRSLASDGTLAFFRVGVVPRSQVEAIFAKVKAITDGVIPPSVPGGPHINAGFESDEDIYRGSVYHKDEDNDSGTGEPSGNNSNISLDMSFADSTNDDEAQIINTAAPTRSTSVAKRKRSSKLSGKYRKTVDLGQNGVTGHVNKVYESVKVRQPSTASETPYAQAARASSGPKTVDSETTDVDSDKGSSHDSDPYEPMVLNPNKSTAEQPESKPKVEDDKESTNEKTKTADPVFHVNPLFESTELNTKL